MLSLVSPDLEAYAQRHTSPPSDLLRELTAQTQALPDPQMQVGPIEGAFLRMLVQSVGATRVLEVGTFSGYSALSMAAGLPSNGKLWTFDRDPAALAVARAAFNKSPHGHKIHVVEGDARVNVARVAAEQAPLDFVFMDADKDGYITYWDAVLPHVRPGGMIVADNTLWSGRVLHPQAPSDHAIVAFNAHAHADPRVETVLLTVRDGMLLARKRTDT